MRYYKILFAEKNGGAEGITEYEQLFAKYKNKINVKTITGVLPLTFTAKGGTAADWTIYGNDDNGTENLMQIIATSKTQSGIIFTVDGDGRITINGTATGVATIYLDWVWGGNAVNAVEPNTTYTVTGGLNTTGVTFYWGTFNSDGTTTQMGAIATTATFTTSAKAEKSRAFIYITEGAVCDNLVCEPMLVKGSTAPDHYIPYQQGVGERTENKMPVPVNGVYSANRTTVTVTDGVYHIVQTVGSGSSSVYIDLPEFEVPDSGYINYLNSMAFATTAVVLRYNGESLSGGYSLTPINRAVAIGSDYAGKKVNQIQIYTTGNVTMDFTIAPMITDSNTYTTYIPYGYEIPISVGENLLDLTGQWYEYNSTVSGINVQTGSITVTGRQYVARTIDVKPNTDYYIDFAIDSYTTERGVAIYNNTYSQVISGFLRNPRTFNTGSYTQIAVMFYSGMGTEGTTSYSGIMLKEGTTAPDHFVPYYHQDYTFYIGSTPLTEGQSISKTSTGVDIELFNGENTVSTTLYNKPDMEIKYK